ncbi:alpha/beta hydrolase [Brevundimonas sp.]|uniref:alpha/beta fold hydrolase n=1 Tax=Brevundimonas sp. TaxID=1871086 RepID=UPI0025BD7CFA|nr:alpha/beta hydrolase [Brevundimonas sp.]
MKFVLPGARPVLCALFLACAAVAPVDAAPAGAETMTAAPFVSDRLSVEVVGAGPDVILIPGLGSSREVWRATADRLKATHRVHLVQLAGFAGEPWTHGDGAFVQPAVDELARYIRDQGLSRPAVIGHSLGGLSGLLLAQQHPDLVGRLMTVDSLPFYSAMYGPSATADSARPFADQAAAMIIGADDDSFRTLQTQTAQSLSKTPSEQDRIVDWSMASDRHALASAMKDVMTTDARPGLAAMTTPVTALYAADADGGPPPALAEAVWSREYSALPGVRLTRVDASRHFIMAAQPQRFAELVDRFLTE